MALKIYYNEQMSIIAMLQEDVAPEAYTSFSFVYCTKDMLEETYTQERELDAEENEVLTEVRAGYKFPEDLAKLKKIAVYTVDVWRKKKQEQGYVHAANGVTYSTTDTNRTNLMGKLQEMTLLNKDSGIFPSVVGAPVPHTKAELEAVGVGIVGAIEAIFGATTMKVAQIMAPEVNTLEMIQTILSDFQAELKELG